MDKYHQLIKAEYENTKSGDSTALLRTVLATADEIGLDQALAYLEDCVVEKRLACSSSPPATLRAELRGVEAVCALL